MKKFLGITALAALSCALIPAAAAAAVTEGSCGENVKWSYANDTLTITGEGAMSDGKQDWYEFADSVKSIDIKEGVTYIGASAFGGCINAQDISIPSTVKKIGGYAFADCKEVEGTSLPAGLEAIGTGAFAGCSKLNNIEIPNGVLSIGTDAFYQTQWLDSSSEDFIVIGDGILYQYRGALINVTLPDEVKTVNSYAFAGNKDLKSVNTAKAVSLGESAFSGCTGLEEIVMEPQLVSVGTSAFKDCTALKSVTIPDTVTKLGEGVFSGCTALYEVNYSSALGEIGPSMFFGNSAMNGLFDLKNVKVIDELAFSASGLRSIKIPGGVEVIGDSAFNDCKYAAYAIIPKTVKTIGDNAFLRCISLKDVYFEGTPSDWEALNIGEGNELLTRAHIYFAGDIKISLNGDYISCDTKPFIENERTLVPMRAIFEAMDADIVWDGEDLRVTATKDDKTIIIEVGSDVMYVNDTPITLDTAAKVVDDRTYVPVRAVAEALDCDVDWDDAAREVVITK
ncbi:MAG: leucine-rich repeat protein [Clostridiales bacterium]|nr:leucine-rich repeat protein [Clostridiales bacterium]